MKNQVRGKMITTSCQCCSVKFEAREADIKRGWGKFCSKRCAAISKNKNKKSTKKLSLNDKVIKKQQKDFIILMMTKEFMSKQWNPRDLWAF
jgi:hypothetical protein